MLYKQLLQLLLVSAPLMQACPMHGVPDYARIERSIAEANLRKRNWVQPTNKKYVITNVHVFDGYEYHNETSSVVIDGSFIGTDATNATIIDGQGATLMPGLIDNHNHPTAVEDLQNLTNYGVTTTMCMSCWAVADLCESFRNQPGLPDFYSAGYSAIVPNSSHSKLAETLPSIDAPQYFIYNTSMIPGWVSDRLANGSDYIKLVAEAYPPTMSQEEHNLIVETTKGMGYWTMTHAATISGYNTSIISNTNFIQHTPADGNLTDAQVAMISAQQQYVTPTANIFVFNNEASQQSLHLTDDQTAAINWTIPYNVKKMYDAGIPLLMGTDASINGNGPAMVYFGSSLHDEMKLISSFGIPNLDILKGATSRAAQAYRLPDRGAISPGMRADLLMIQGNPLEDMSAIDNIVQTWTAGLSN